MRRSKREKRNIKIKGHTVHTWDSEKIRLPEDNRRRAIKRYFGSHAWADKQLDYMECSVCDVRAYLSLARSKGFKIVVNGQFVGWSDGPIRTCDEMVIDSVHEA